MPLSPERRPLRRFLLGRNRKNLKHKHENHQYVGGSGNQIADFAELQLSGVILFMLHGIPLLQFCFQLFQ